MASDVTRPTTGTPPTTTKVTAVVVSYQRSELLRTVLTALTGQTRPPDRIIVVDNGSTDGSRELVRSFGGIEWVFTTENLGGAGGFARGLDWALADGADAVWLLDDDAEPDRDCLSHLLAARDRAGEAAFWAARVIQDGTQPGRSPEGFVCSDLPTCDQAAQDQHVAVCAATFVGVLINAESARTQALPIADYFIWHDDTEYTSRLASSVCGRWIGAAVIRHHAPSPGPAQFVAERARRNVRNMVWCLRLSRSSAIGWRQWADMLRSTIVNQIRTAALGAKPYAVALTFAGLFDALRMPLRESPGAQVRASRRAGDEISISLALAEGPNRLQSGNKS